MAMIELTTCELSLVAGGDAGFAIVFDDAGVSTFSGSGFSQPTASAINVTVNAVADKNGEFEATLALFSNTGVPED
jgi:hypothetical protein